MMNNFTVIVEHDRYSRKPIYINFKVSLVDSDGKAIHTAAFKERNFDYGMYLARQYERKLNDPVFLIGTVATGISDNIGFKIDTTKDPADLMSQIFENASDEWLEEYLKRTKNEKDIQFIKNELTKRGELS